MTTIAGIAALIMNGMFTEVRLRPVEDHAVLESVTCKTSLQLRPNPTKRPSPPLFSKHTRMRRPRKKVMLHMSCATLAMHSLDR